MHQLRNGFRLFIFIPYADLAPADVDIEVDVVNTGIEIDGDSDVWTVKTAKIILTVCLVIKSCSEHVTLLIGFI